MRFVVLATAVLTLACSSRRDPKRNASLIEAATTSARDSEISVPRPILSVRDLKASQTYYRDALGFEVDWEHGDPPDFGSVSRSNSVLFMCQHCQGTPGSWTMMFVRDVDKLHDELVSRHAIIKSPPTNMPWGLREMQVADPDGNIMRFGTAIED